MKIENLERATKLKSKLNALTGAILSAEGIRKNRNEQDMYSFYLHEFRDGSGFRIELCGCGIGAEIVEFTIMKLKEKKDEVIKEIESL